MKPPKHLEAMGKQQWLEVVGAFELEPAQLPTLRIACEALDTSERARLIIKNEGMVAETKMGPRKHPAIAMQHDAWRDYLAAMRALELDIEPPQDRPGRPAGR